MEQEKYLLQSDLSLSQKRTVELESLNDVFKQERDEILSEVQVYKRKATQFEAEVSEYKSQSASYKTKLSEITRICEVAQDDLMQKEREVEELQFKINQV